MTETTIDETGQQRYARHARLIREAFNDHGSAERATFIKDQKIVAKLARESIKMEQVLGVSTEGYYKWLADIVEYYDIIIGNLEELRPKIQQNTEEKKPNSLEAALADIPENISDFKNQREIETKELKEVKEEKPEVALQATIIKKKAKKKPSGKKRKHTLKSLGVVKTLQVHKVPIEKVKLPNDVVLFDGKIDASFMRSIVEAGEINTVIRTKPNKKGELIALDNLMVLMAAKMALKKDTKVTIADLTVIIEDGEFKGENSEIQVIEKTLLNEKAKPVIDIYTAKEFVKNMLASDMSKTQIIKDTGISGKYYSDISALIQATENTEKLISNKKLPLHLAIDIIKTSTDGEDQDKRVQRYIEEQKAEQPKPENVTRRVNLEPKNTGEFVSPNRARNLLSAIAMQYSVFIRSKLPAKDTNDEWVQLTILLQKARNLRIAGQLPIN